MPPVTLTFRQAVPSEWDLLTGICHRAKQSHGYDDEMMKIFLGDGDMVISAEAIERDTFMLASIGDRVVGFAHLMPVKVPETIYLEDLFIEPDAQGAGVGRALFNWALVEAGNRGFRWLEWDSDPNASAFYAKMGGEKISHQESGLFPGRFIPKFRRPTAPVPKIRPSTPPPLGETGGPAEETWLRTAKQSDVLLLASMCRRAKLSLGYDESILDLWAAQGDMRFDPDLICTHPTVIAMVGGSPAGFAQVRESGVIDTLKLVDLCVDPEFQAQGVGRMLFAWAQGIAENRDCEWLVWESDPLTTDYYRKLGAHQYDQMASTLIPVRTIPLFRIAIAGSKAG